MKFVKSKLLLIVLSISFLFSLSGCSNSDDKKGENDLNVHIGGNLKTIDPSVCTDSDGATFISQCFEGLMMPNENGDIVNGQAKAYHVSKDGLTYTFTLKNDLKWSDGKPVTAHDFVYSWRRLVDPTTASQYNYMIEMVKNANEIMTGKKKPEELGIVALSNTTLQVYLTAPCSYFLEICAFPTCVPLREDVIEKNPKWANSPETYICNGPFVLTDWLRDSYMTIMPNENYYDKASVKPTKVSFKLIAKDSTVLAAFKTGELDVGNMIPSDEMEKMKGKGLITESNLGIYYLSINLNINDGKIRSQKNKALLDKKVRRALALAIDRNYIVKNVTKSGELPADSFVPPAVQRDSNGNDMYESIEKWWDNSTYKENCDEARRLLSEAGVKGSDITVEYLYNSEGGHVGIAEAIQNMWKKELGITTTCRNEEWAVFQDSRTSGKFQIARNGWLADYHDAMTFSDLLTSTNGNNNSFYNNPEYDALIKKAKASQGAEYDQIIVQAEKILKEDTPVIPLYFYTHTYLKSDKLDGLFTYMNHFYFKNTVKNN